MGNGHQKDKTMFRSFIFSGLYFPFSREGLEITLIINKSYVRKPT